MKTFKQETGIGIDILLKAMQNGIYCFSALDYKHTNILKDNVDWFYLKKRKDDNGNVSYTYWLNVDFFDGNQNATDYCLSDYGKTWALTKEELESK